MKSIKLIIIVLTLTLGLYSCEFEIDYKDNLPKDKLVVTSFIEADSTISFSLYKSAVPGTYSSDESFGLKTKTKDLNDAIVRDAKADLYINGILKESLSQSNSNDKYIFTTIPKENENVEIRLNYKNNEAIGKANLVLIKPIIDSSNVYIQETQDEDGFTYQSLIVYLEIRDNGLGDNYYKIEPSLFYKANDGTYIYTTLLDMNSAKLLWENIKGVYKENSSIEDESLNRYGVISNKKFKGSTYKIKLSFFSIQEGAYKKTKIISQKIIGNLVVSSIEKKAYDYLYTLNKYLDNSYMNLEPITIINGIENAYGFIGAKKSNKVKEVNITL